MLCLCKAGWSPVLSPAGRLESEASVLGYDIDDLKASDAPEFVALFRSYAEELLHIQSTLTTEAVVRDGLGSGFDGALAREQSTQEMVGLVAWQQSYDLHWGIRGAAVLDLYVAPEHRCRALGPALLNHVARRTASAGGCFLVGQGIVNPSHPERLHQRCAVTHEGVECILGGRAFEVFAALRPSDLREFIRALSPKEWNYLP